MKILVLFLTGSLPNKTYLALLGMFCGVYLLLINPIIFKLWIIPKIELRYGMRLRTEWGQLLYPYPWLVPPIEISFYIFSLCIKWKKLSKNKRPYTAYYKLNKVGYDLKDASRLEIIFSFITMFCIFYLIVCIFIF